MLQSRESGNAVMKIAVVHNCRRPTTGGGDSFEATIARALSGGVRDSRHRYMVFGPTDILQRVEPGPNMSIVSVGNRTLHRVAAKVHCTLRKVASPTTDQGSGDLVVARALSRENVDVMWCVSPYTPTMEIPFLTTVWDLQHRLQPWFPEVSSGGEWSMRELAFTQRLRRAAFVLTGTEVGKSEVMRFYGVSEERVKVLPLPTPGFVLEPREHSNDEPVLKKHGLRPGYLFYPAQFWPHKNHVGLLHSLSILRERHDLRPTLVFIGSNQGTYGHVRQLTTELGLRDQVRFLGFIPQHELVSLYRNALALTFVSFFGPDNLPPLEAFATGCPVIASDVPGAREQLGDAALFVDPKTPREIADGVHRIALDPSLREALVERGHQRAQRWTGGDYVRSVVDLLDDLQAFVRCWRRA